MIKLTDKDFLLSSDDSGLKNVWEEICIQKQVEESFHWDAYDNTIENFIRAEFEKQPEAVKKLVRYIGSLSNNNFDSDEEYAGSDEDAIEEIKNGVLEKASNYQSQNMDSFLNKEEGAHGEYDDNDDES